MKLAWKTAVIGEVVERAQTWNPSRSPVDEVFEYIDLSAVDQDAKMIMGAREVPCGEAPSRARQLVESGDILVSTVRPNLNGVACVPGHLDGATASTGFCVVRASKTKANSAYLFHWVKSPMFIADMVSKATGASYPAVSDRIIFESQIPLPPLAEQKRIAAILDAADALRTKRRESLAQLDALLQSTFLNLFGDPVANPMGWERKTLGEITSIDAPMVDPKDERFAHLLHYGPERIEKGTGNLLPALSAREDQLISGKFLCHPGEILYSKIRPNLNKVALVQEKCLCSADVYPVLPNPKFANREYLFTVLRSSAFLDYVAGFSRRANIPKINRGQFAGYYAPLPPLPLQQKFAAIVESVERQKAAQRAHLAELDALFAALQHRAFRGEL
jgi:type I restriction enzyme S subunit